MHTGSENLKCLHHFTPKIWSKIRITIKTFQFDAKQTIFKFFDKFLQHFKHEDDVTQMQDPKIRDPCIILPENPTPLLNHNARRAMKRLEISN